MKGFNMAEYTPREQHWLKLLYENPRYTYHTGYLPKDRMWSKELNLDARILLRLASKGAVQLLQRRISDMKYEYRVQRLDWLN